MPWWTTQNKAKTHSLLDENIHTSRGKLMNRLNHCDVALTTVTLGWIVEMCEMGKLEIFSHNCKV